MKIGEARNNYYKMYQKYSEEAAKTLHQKEKIEKEMHLHPLDKKEYEEEAATLELRYKELTEKGEEYLNYQSEIIEMEVAYANMKTAEQQSEVMEESAGEQSKILETARRITRGDVVPPQDEEKLMKYDFKLYMMAKQAGAMAKQHEEDESLWEEESEAPQDVEDPMEYADNQEAPLGGPPLDADVVASSTEAPAESEA